MIKYCENVHHAAHSPVLHATAAGDGFGSKLSSVVARYRGPVEGPFPVREQEECDRGSWEESAETEDFVCYANYSGRAGNVTFTLKSRLSSFTQEF